jgi:hypothetical protein
MKTEFKLRPIVYEGIDFDDYKFNMETNDVIGPRGWILKPRLTTWDYYRVKLYKDKKEHGIYLHRLVYQMHNKDEDIKGFEIDHKDRNKLNNDIDNLRKATHVENSQNRAPSGKSKYIGVYWHKRDQKWRARYRDGSTKHIGLYITELEAAHTYDETILRLGLNNGFRPLNRDLYPDDFQNFTKINNLLIKMVKQKKVTHVQAEPEPVHVDPVTTEDIQKNQEVTQIEVPEAPEAKKGRGRPRKPKEEQQEQAEPVEKPKRGRPRKEKPENPEPPREKLKRGPKPSENGRVALGANVYGKVYYKDNKYDINRKRLIREISKGKDPSDKMMLKYNIN